MLQTSPPLKVQAAANPEETDYFYYVLIDTDGTHGFSETLEEHNQKKEEAKAAQRE
jgi:cell division protein YceG involved in septum cleavage